MNIGQTPMSKENLVFEIHSTKSNKKKCHGSRKLSGVTYPADRGCTRVSRERHGHLPREMHPHLRVMRSSSMEDARSP